jgi:hypothetical protein
LGFEGFIEFAPGVGERAHRYDAGAPRGRGVAVIAVGLAIPLEAPEQPLGDRLAARGAVGEQQDRTLG